jgi:hypothetical protein
MVAEMQCVSEEKREVKFSCFRRNRAVDVRYIGACKIEKLNSHSFSGPFIDIIEHLILILLITR